MAGRPKRVFTPEELQGIERYARINCNTETIADGMNIPITTLKRHFGRKLTHWRASGKLNMRVNLHKQAENSAQTAIFIAKNELGMVDKQEITDGTQKQAIVVTPEQQRFYAEVAKEVMARQRQESKAEPQTIKFKGT